MRREAVVGRWGKVSEDPRHGHEISLLSTGRFGFGWSSISRSRLFGSVGRVIPGLDAALVLLEYQY